MTDTWTIIWTHLPALITSIATLIVALKTQRTINGERAQMLKELAQLRKERGQ